MGMSDCGCHAMVSLATGAPKKNKKKKPFLDPGATKRSSFGPCKDAGQLKTTHH